MLQIFLNIFNHFHSFYIKNLCWINWGPQVWIAQRVAPLLWMTSFWLRLNKTFKGRIIVAKLSADLTHFQCDGWQLRNKTWLPFLSIWCHIQIFLEVDVVFALVFKWCIIFLLIDLIIIANVFYYVRYIICIVSLCFLLLCLGLEFWFQCIWVVLCLGFRIFGR